MKIYISGKIDQGNEVFEAAEALIKSLGLTPLNPTKLENQDDKSRIKALMNCDAIYMLNNFESSAQCKLEQLNAVHLKMMVFHEDYKFKLNELLKNTTC